MDLQDDIIESKIFNDFLSFLVLLIITQSDKIDLTKEIAFLLF